jgi:parallel beta-helix repeat protein
MNVARRWACALLAALVVSLLMPGAALAANGRTVYVDDDGTPNAAGSGKCGRPNYASIQAAVNDLSARRVVVCKGTYIEQVTVERDLTLEGRPGAVIQAPAGEHLAIVLFRGPQTSRLKGFTITGAGSDTVAAGIRTNGFVGDEIAYGPTIVTISNNHVSDIRDTRNGRVDGTGIFIFQSQADVSDNTVERYGAIGISADGDDRADTSAQIDGNTITGQGGGGANETQIGLRLDETTVDAEDNIISGNIGSGPGAFGVGILIEFASGSIRDNELTQNGTGIRFAPGGDVVLRSNEVSGSINNGIELFSSFSATVVENESSNNGGSGIYLAAGTQGNTVRGNKARNNGGIDIVDDTGNPPANTYKGNKCNTSTPAGLCK